MLTQSMPVFKTKKAVREYFANHPEALYSPMPESIKKLYPVITVKNVKDFGIHFTTDHQGKMSGMESWSSTCKACELCKKRIDQANACGNVREFIKADPLRTDLIICGFCFSDAQQNYQKQMTDPLMRNHIILNGGVIHTDYLPILNDLYFRCESFGDFSSVNAVINFFNLARKNKNVKITAWTKNPWFFKEAIDGGYKKPKNFKLIYSSLFINRVAEIPEGYEDIIDARFTVYTKQFAELHQIKINCGALSCLNCLRCYATPNTKFIDISEVLK